MDRLFQKLRTNKILENIGKGEFVLDVGCNDNEKFFREMKEQFDNYVGIDTRLKNYDGLNFVKYFVKDSLPFRDNSFDTVTMIAVFEHLERKEEAMKEALRVLKKGGKVVMTTPSPKAEPMIRLLAHLGLISKELADEHNNLMNKNQIGKLLSEVSFKNVEVSRFEFGLNYFISAEK
jgi:ubiquinone/menaquinone biosynthesis C-methylase UbiE